MDQNNRIEVEPEDLTCAICKEIFVSPRFLTGCYHSFCCECIEHAADKDATFTCPECGELTFLPEGGASELQVNFYFKEEVLEEAQRLMSRNCSYHANQEIDRVCLKCKMAACPKCTGHGEELKHQLQLLPEAEEAMSDQVQEIEEYLTMNSQELENLRSRTNAQLCQLHLQRDLLHAKVEEQFKMNNRGLWQIYLKESEKLTKEITRLQQECIKSKCLRHLYRRSMEGPPIASLVDVAEQVHVRLNEKLGLPPSPAKVSACSVTLPGLECNIQTDDFEIALKQFLGCPTQHLPLTEGAKLPPTKDIRVPLRLGRSKEVREILSVVPSYDGQVVICFRGDPPHLYCSVATVQAEDGTVLTIDQNTLLGKGVCVYDYTKPENLPFMVKMSYYGVFQVSKAVPSVCLVRDQFGTIRLHRLGVSQHSLGATRYVPIHEPQAETLLQHLDTVDPINFDVSRKGNYYAIVDRVKDASKTVSQVPKKRKLEDDENAGTSTKKKKTAEMMNGTEENEDVEMFASSKDHLKRVIQQPPFGAVVKLFRKGQTQPVDIYCATNPSFLPSDVSFCHFGKHNVLLIADWQNDEIHVVRVKKNKFHFQRLLAERQGELVKPSALNTDPSGGVWVGCSNGTLLCCNMSD